MLEQRVEALEAEERVESARYQRLAAERVHGDERVALLEREEAAREVERAREDALREDERNAERLQRDERVAELERAQVNSPTESSTYCIVNY